ncbi:hypothetical protein FB479_104463 [Brevibacillus sp. AG162]|nr:hypothetical protein FB479_104463 [Brevibacillus sp. AG162]
MNKFNLTSLAAGYDGQYYDTIMIGLLREEFYQQAKK